MPSLGAALLEDRDGITFDLVDEAQLARESWGVEAAVQGAHRSFDLLEFDLAEGHDRSPC
jgi:hypothetical protein